MYFTKMHGVGNDYILIDCISQNFSKNPAELALKMCDRHTGVGGDGILLLYPPENRDACCYMEMYNADGSFSPICGNGLRMIAHYAHQNKYTREKTFCIETQCGLRKVLLHHMDRGSADISVCMGRPAENREHCSVCRPESCAIRLMIDDPKEVFGREIQHYPVYYENRQWYLNAFFVEMGNPHCIIFVDCPPDRLSIAQIGNRIEKHAAFPARTNVEFAYYQRDNAFSVRVWERGSGETMTCGSGACAVYYAACQSGLCDGKGTIYFPGGSLQVFDEQEEGIVLRGKTTIVYEGKYNE